MKSKRLSLIFLVLITCVINITSATACEQPIELNEQAVLLPIEEPGPAVEVMILPNIDQCCDKCCICCENWCVECCNQCCAVGSSDEDFYFE